MEELIRIRENGKGEKAVSARELYNYLGATERFSFWIKRMFKYGFEENMDYVGCKEFNTLANQELDDYILTLDCAKEISMLQKSEKGKIARRYFITCEKKLKDIIKKQLQQANERHKVRYKKSIRLKEVDREISSLMRERKHLVKEINYIDRTSIIFLDLFEDSNENLYFGGFPNRKIS